MNDDNVFPFFYNVILGGRSGSGGGSGPTGIQLLDVLDKTITGDVDIAVSPTFENHIGAELGGLFQNCKISSLKVSGIENCPKEFVKQEGLVNQTVLETVEMDCLALGDQCCKRATHLVSAKFPNANREKVNYSYAGAQAFLSCNHLTDVQLPLYPTIQEKMFDGCSALTFLDLPSVTRIRPNAFLDCHALATIVLRANSVAVLENINAFSGTPFANGGSGGTIYVPSSLISSYQAESNWSTLYGYGALTFSAIEGSVYDT